MDLSTTALLAAHTPTVEARPCHYYTTINQVSDTAFTIKIARGYDDESNLDIDLPEGRLINGYFDGNVLVITNVTKFDAPVLPNSPKSEAHTNVMLYVLIDALSAIKVPTMVVRTDLEEPLTYDADAIEKSKRFCETLGVTQCPKI